MTCDSAARGWGSGEKAAVRSARGASPAPQCRRGGRGGNEGRNNNSRGRGADLKEREAGERGRSKRRKRQGERKGLGAPAPHRR